MMLTVAVLRKRLIKCHTSICRRGGRDCQPAPYSFQAQRLFTRSNQIPRFPLMKKKLNKKPGSYCV
jgi:hypothetical protein